MDVNFARRWEERKRYLGYDFERKKKRLTVIKKNQLLEIGFFSGSSINHPTQRRTTFVFFQVFY